MALQDDRRANTAQAERLHKFAHDLRNRLAGMQQVLQHLGMNAKSEEARELYEFGLQQHFKALRETEVLLDDLGVDRSVGPMELHRVPLSELTRKTIVLLEHRFNRKAQPVAITVDDQLHVLADAHYLGEILAALLSNASKFSPKGAAISVHAATIGDRVELTVTDPGVGLSAADLDRSFIRYAWLDSRSTDGEPQGRATLAKAAQWANAMDGTLTATSTGPGAGSSFVLGLAKG